MHRTYERGAAGLTNATIMPQKLEQHAEAVQQQQLSNLQVAVAKLVELPVTDLAERVRNEMLDNAALEEADGRDGGEDAFADGCETDAYGGGSDNDGGDDMEGGEEVGGGADTAADDPETAIERDAEDPYEGADYGGEADAMGDYLSADDAPDYLVQRAEGETERREAPLSSGMSFYEDLKSQIGERDLTEHEGEVMEYLVGSLDADGFLRKDDATLSDELAIYRGVQTTPEEVARLVAVLQTFEPRGVGARSLRECMRIQLSDPDRRTPYTQMALAVVDKYFKDFAAKRWDVVRRRLGADEETFAHVLHELTHVNPLPGTALGETAAATSPAVVPDFLVEVRADGEAVVTLNSGDVPELRVSRAFRESISQYVARRGKLTREQRDAYVYARGKVEAAQSFINLLSRRNQTLLAVMRAIVRLQRSFFDEDDEDLLRPLALKDVAALAGVDISTVSRVTSSKYVQTGYGVYPLKFFFSSQFTASDGEELSARKVRAVLRSLVEGEDKRRPYSDDALAAMLKERGFAVARRTVAKYRDAMGFPTARLRKEV